MKVKDLIKDSIWRPGKLYDPKVKPAISVLLPTFGRGKSGLFRRAVESVLDQTLEDIELIIIDDASTDGTADQIKEFMKEDGRISAIIHPRNIGLPAISEYEGFMRARADYLAFAFDDDIFYPDALEQLLDHTLNNPGKVCYGHVLMRVQEQGSTSTFEVSLGSELGSTNLRTRNIISNNAVLLPRHVIEDVGFYDPRIVLARYCDWDLWRRIGETYLLEHVDVAVGEITSPVTTNSLAHTYALDSWACESVMRSDRDSSLRPDAFANVDIDALPDCNADHLSREAARELADNYFARRFWLRDGSPARPAPDGSILVVTLAHTVSTALYFDHLPNSVKSRVRVVTPGLFSVAELGRASCLILVRVVEPFMEWLEAARRLQIPVYYFLDDNFPELALSENLEFEESMTLPHMRERLKKVDGVLLSTQSLLDYFEANLVHPRLYLYPPCYKGRPIETRARGGAPAELASDKAPATQEDREAPGTNPRIEFDLTFAWLGGSHRQRGLAETIMPAIQRLATNRTKIRLVVAGCAEPAALGLEQFSSENLQVSCLPFETDWKRLLVRISEFHPDVLIHGPSETVNNKYKTLNAALNANLLNAVLIAPNHAPFDDPDFADAAVLVDPPRQAKAWLVALSKLLSDRASWGRYKRANARYCRKHFSGEQNASVLETMLETAPPVGFAAVENRLRMLYSAFAMTATASDLHSLKTSLTELARMRKAHRRYRNLRFFLSGDDLWPWIAPAFESVRADIVKRRIRKQGMRLELSDSLHDRDCAKYRINLPAGTLQSVSCGFASEGIHKGVVALEIISPEGTIVLHTALALSTLNLHAPVSFNADLKIPKCSDFSVRIVAHSEWPLYIYELASYSALGLRRCPIAPFASFNYSEDS